MIQWLTCILYSVDIPGGKCCPTRSPLLLPRTSRIRDNALQTTFDNLLNSTGNCLSKKSCLPTAACYILKYTDANIVFKTKCKNKTSWGFTKSTGASFLGLPICHSNTTLFIILSLLNFGNLTKPIFVKTTGCWVFTVKLLTTRNSHPSEVVDATSYDVFAFKIEFCWHTPSFIL